MGSIDTSRPHSARMYDYFLGGKDNYEVDRVAANKMIDINPHTRFAARTNRAFVLRATQFAAGQGIRQFLDIGTGIPTEPNLHQVAQEIAPDARVVYVDNDPLVLAHARALLVGTEQGRTMFVPADVRDPRAILDSAELRDNLDLSQPVAVSLVAVMHFISDADAPWELVATLMDAVAPGSYLAMCHATADFSPKESAREAVQIYDAGDTTFRPRSRAEFTRFFDGLEMVEPGVEVPHRWRPSVDPIESDTTYLDSRVGCLASVARKPG